MGVGAIEHQGVSLFGRERRGDIVIVVGGEQLGARDNAEFGAGFGDVGVIDMQAGRLVVHHRGEVVDVNQLKGVDVRLFAGAAEDFGQVESERGGRGGECRRRAVRAKTKRVRMGLPPARSVCTCRTGRSTVGKGRAQSLGLGGWTQKLSPAIRERSRARPHKFGLGSRALGHSLQVGLTGGRLTKVLRPSVRRLTDARVCKRIPIARVR